MNKGKKDIKADIEKHKKILKILSIIIVILVILLLISKSFGTFNNIKLNKNKKTIFSISDLTINNLSYSNLEEEIIEEFGKPKKENIIKDSIYRYKRLYYDGLILTLKENYNDYMLVKVEITGKKYKTSRNIKVGDSILSVMNKYKIENEKSTYIYGNYSTDALNNPEIKENIYFSVRSKEEIVYINRDTIVDDNTVNIARLNISYKKGRVSKILWSYDYK